MGKTCSLLKWNPKLRFDSAGYNKLKMLAGFLEVAHGVRAEWQGNRTWSRSQMNEVTAFWKSPMHENPPKHLIFVVAFHLLFFSPFYSTWHKWLPNKLTQPWFDKLFPSCITMSSTRATAFSTALTICHFLIINYSCLNQGCTEMIRLLCSFQHSLSEGFALSSLFSRGPLSNGLGIKLILSLMGIQSPFSLITSTFLHISLIAWMVKNAAHAGLGTCRTHPVLGWITTALSHILESSACRKRWNFKTCFSSAPEIHFCFRVSR